MSELTDELEKNNPDPAITLRLNINSHMSAMLDRATNSLEMISWANDNADKKLVDIRDVRPEGRNIEQDAVNEENKQYSTVPLKCDESIFLKNLNTFLSTDVNEAILNGTVGLQFFLSIGIRYYFERLKDKNFFIMSDLSEMLSVDRKMNELITACEVIASTLKHAVNEEKRKHNQRVGKREGPDLAWKKVREALVKLNNNPTQKAKKWAISAIASEINKEVGCTPNTVIVYFKNHFGDSITGKKNSKKNYYISDLINMIDIQ